MAAARLISTRLTVCAACGHEARLIAATSDEVLSRCYACGDVTRTAQRVPQAWSPSAAVRERSLTGIHMPAVEPGRHEPLATG